MKSKSGFTLLEFILVLVIAASILFLGFRQYLGFRADADVLAVKANVDTLFDGMTLYYKANCYGVYDTSTGYSSGTLNPDANPPPSLQDPKVLNLNTDLVATGFIVTQQGVNVFPLNPIINNSGTLGQEGYVVQFNPSTAPRTVCTNKEASDCAPKTIGTILMWRPQVSILLKETNLKTQMLPILGGDCLSSPISGDDTAGIHPCKDNVPGDYVVWERLSSLSAASQKSSFWQINPTVQQFNQMYRTYPINYLLSQAGQTPNEKPQYFLCGG